MDYVITTTKGDLEAVFQLCLNHKDELEELCGSEDKAQATLEELKWLAEEDKDYL
jgi:hypothetical protein